MLRAYVASLLALAAIIHLGVTGQFCDEAVEIVKDNVQQKNHNATNVIYFSDGSNFDDEVRSSGIVLDRFRDRSRERRTSCKPLRI